MVSKILKYKYLILLFILSLILLLINYKPGTFLIGWDNLIPEFNIIANLKRSLSGVWLENRGLGLYDGMSHIANFMHTVYTAILFLILPLNMIRYASIVLLHFVGGVGALVLFSSLGLGGIVSFIASLFYMFNIGTVQQFIAPFETFSFHFGALPWLMWSGIRFLKLKNKQSLLLFFLLSLLFTPQAFVPTVFLVNLSALSCLIFFDAMKNKTIRNALMLILVTLIVNSFWLIPYLYGLPQNARVIQKARINEFSSEGVYLRNKNRGDLVNVLQLKGFMMDTVEYNSKDNVNVNIMQPWQKHISSLPYSIAYLVVVFTAIFGLIRSIKEKRNLFFLFSLSVSFFFLANNVFVIREVHESIRTLFPVLGEMFRFPFTKFITLFVLSLSFYLAYGIHQLEQLLNKKNLVLMGFLTAMLVISLPAFQGNFFSFLVRRTIPQEYLQLFNYFDTQAQHKRIALLPTYSFWFWRYRTWGYVGSGFLWYGIAQPMMDRAFDPWNDKNEQFYNELTYAIKQNNTELFNFILDKYNIGFVLLDQYLVNNLASKPIDYEKLISFLDSNQNIEKDLIAGKLIVYKTKKDKQKTYIISDVPKLNPYSQFYYKDPAFPEIKNYVVDAKNPDLVFPFANLFTEKIQSDREFNIEVNENYLVFTPKENLFKKIKQNEDYRIRIPDLLNSQIVPVRIVQNQGFLIAEIVYPQIRIDGTVLSTHTQSILIPLQKREGVNELLLTESNQRVKSGDIFYLFKGFPNTLQISYQNGNTEFQNVNLDDFPKVTPLYEIRINSLSSLEVFVPISRSFSKQERIEESMWQSKNNQRELTFYYPDLSYQTGYIIIAKSHWENGLQLHFYIDSPFTHRTELESKIAKERNYTNVFILPPNNLFGSGYGFHFTQEDVRSNTGKTDISNFAVYPFPYEFISEIRAETMNQPSRSESYYVLSQSFHTGWIAFADGKLLPHVLVNNWANAWRLEESPKSADQTLREPSTDSSEKANGKLRRRWNNNSTILIFFWPQVLEFVGFGIMVLALIFIVSYRTIKPYEKTNNQSQ